MNPEKPGWQTTEWGTLITMLIKNAIMFLTVMGYLNQEDAAHWEVAVMAVVGAGFMFVIEAVIFWKYVSSRTSIKETSINKQDNTPISK